MRLWFACCTLWPLGWDSFSSRLLLFSASSCFSDIPLTRSPSSCFCCCFQAGPAAWLQKVAAQYCPSVAAAVRHCCCPAFLCFHSSPCAERPSGIAIHGKAFGERGFVSACGIHHGNALSNWLADARSFRWTLIYSSKTARVMPPSSGLGR